MAVAPRAEQAGARGRLGLGGGGAAGGDVAGEQGVRHAQLKRVDCGTQIEQGWPKPWARSRPLIEIPSQNAGPRRTVWANSVQLASMAEHNRAVVRAHEKRLAA